MTHRTPVHPSQEATPEWIKQVSQHSTDIRQIDLDVGTPTQVSANTTDEQTFTITGLLTEDTIISVTKPTHQAGLGIVGSRVSATDTLAITYMNNTGSGITPTASEEYTVVLLKNRI